MKGSTRPAHQSTPSRNKPRIAPSKLVAPTVYPDLTGSRALGGICEICTQCGGRGCQCSPSPSRSQRHLRKFCLVARISPVRALRLSRLRPTFQYTPQSIRAGSTLAWYKQGFREALTEGQAACFSAASARPVRPVGGESQNFFSLLFVLQWQYGLWSTAARFLFPATFLVRNRNAKLPSNTIARVALRYLAPVKF